VQVLVLLLVMDFIFPNSLKELQVKIYTIYFISIHIKNNNFMIFEKLFKTTIYFNLGGKEIESQIITITYSFSITEFQNIDPKYSIFDYGVLKDKSEVC
jgi:hypothetical protein